MKKTVCLLLAALLTVSAFAQKKRDIIILYSDDGMVSLEAFGHFGWGYHFVSSSDFVPGSSGEILLNALKMKFYPVKNFGIEFGGDLRWNYYGSKNCCFAKDVNNLIYVTDYMFEGERKQSQIHTFSITVPVLAKFKAGRVSIGFGAETNFNLTGGTYYRFERNDALYEYTDFKARVTPFTYDFLATVSHEDLTLFAKYYPEGVRVLPVESLSFSLWTVGIAIGL